jgi:hypothetical protein
VKAVSLRRFAKAEVVLGVKGVRADHAAALVRADADLAAQARVAGDTVEVSW